MKSLTKSEKAAKRETAITYLRECLNPGDKIYTMVTHVSASGMSRRIRVMIVGGTQHGEPPYIRDISYLVARALNWRRSQADGGVIVGGCGMDMAFHLVYTLGYVLWPKGSNCGRNGEPDHDGGYSLQHMAL